MPEPLRIPLTVEGKDRMIRRQQQTITEQAEQIAALTDQSNTAPASVAAVDIVTALDHMGCTLDETKLRRIVSEQERTITAQARLLAQYRDCEPVAA